LVVRSEARADVLGVEVLGRRGRADDVAEENRDELALLGGWLGDGEGGATSEAELRDLRVLLAALRTDGHASSVARPTAAFKASDPGRLVSYAQIGWPRSATC
jgi:hypothetical protein